MLKILHTSDWHLGRSLYGRKRYAEFSAFLNWLEDTITAENIDVLLIAGDIFDTGTPSNRAQELYYRFLCRISNSCCRHIVIVAGNHDSPSFLNAPKELLQALNVHVIGALTENLDDEVVVLNGCDNDNSDVGKTAIICAVPYLRDKDIRTVEAGESIEEKNRKLAEGIKNHYANVVAIAEQKRAELLETKEISANIPIIAMGHLFTAGGKTVDGDGVRELYVGSLAHIGAEMFPTEIDYFALGHLHVPQSVGGNEHIRYSGSPIPMGFGEAKQQKSVAIVTIQNDHPEIKLQNVPCFQPLIRIIGSLDEILSEIEQLKQENSCAWLEIEYSGNAIVGNLLEIVDEAMSESTMEIGRVINRRVMNRVINAIHSEETLDDLDVSDVFERCLDNFDVPSEDRKGLTESYNEIIQHLAEQDVNAE